MRGPGKHLALMLLLTALGACSSGPQSIDLSAMSIIAAPGANAGNAVAVDVVLVLDAGLEKELLALPARDWFKKREQVRRDYPDGLVVRSFELVPGQSVPSVDIDAPRNPIAALIYADYAAPGDHRLRVGVEDEAVDVLLQTSDVIARRVKAQ